MNMDKPQPINDIEENKTMYTHLIAIVDLVNERQKKVLHTFDVTHSQFNILRILKGAAPSALSLKEVQKRMVFGNPDITRLISRLEQKGWVIRPANSMDLRKIDIQLSKEGVALLDQLSPEMESTIFNFFTDIVSRDEAMRMNEVLHRMRDALAI